MNHLISKLLLMASVAVLSVCMLCACDSPENPDSPPLQEENSDPIYLSLYVATSGVDTEFGMTRADDYPNTSTTEAELISTREGTINNLYLVTFDDTNKYNKTFELEPFSENDKKGSTTIWRHYKTTEPIEKGKYSFFVFANYEDYLKLPDNL